MKANKMFFGNGDFKKCISILAEQRRVDFKDIGNKLVLLKTGHLYHKDKQIDINDQNDNNVGIQMYKDAVMGENERTAIYADASFDHTPGNRAVNLKVVFRVWSRQIYGQLDQSGDILTQRQLENIFPEFRPRLKLYHTCCDATGKIVKNKEYYQWYKNQDYEVKGTRGGN